MCECYCDGYGDVETCLMLVKLFVLIWHLFSKDLSVLLLFLLVSACFTNEFLTFVSGYVHKGHRRTCMGFLSVTTKTHLFQKSERNLKAECGLDLNKQYWRKSAKCIVFSFAAFNARLQY